MSVTVLDQLHDAFEALRDALDGDDVAAIDAATARVDRAVAEVRGVGAWRDEPVVRERLSALIPLMEAARVRASVLSDHARQRMDMLAMRGVATASLTYRR